MPDLGNERNDEWDALFDSTESADTRYVLAGLQLLAAQIQDAADTVAEAIVNTRNR